MELIALSISITSLCFTFFVWWYGTREENWAIDFDLTDLEDWKNDISGLSHIEMDGTDETGKYKSS